MTGTGIAPAGAVDEGSPLRLHAVGFALLFAAVLRAVLLFHLLSLQGDRFVLLRFAAMAIALRAGWLLLRRGQSRLGSARWLCLVGTAIEAVQAYYFPVDGAGIPLLVFAASTVALFLPLPGPETAQSRPPEESEEVPGGVVRIGNTFFDASADLVADADEPAAQAAAAASEDADDSSPIWPLARGRTAAAEVARPESVKATSPAPVSAPAPGETHDGVFRSGNTYFADAVPEDEAAYDIHDAAEPAATYTFEDDEVPTRPMHWPSAAPVEAAHSMSAAPPAPPVPASTSASTHVSKHAPTPASPAAARAAQRPLTLRNIPWLLFSFTGEIGRGQFWMGLPLAILVLSPLTFLLNTMEDRGSDNAKFVFLWFVALLGLMLAALAVKRCRARNRPLVWLVFALVPYVGQAWFLWEFGLRSGRAQNADAVDIPDVVRVKKTRSLPQVDLLDVLNGGLNEEIMRKLGYDEREKRAHKGSNPHKELKGAPKGWFILFKQGIVFLDKGREKLTLGKGLHMAFDKVIGEFGIIGAVAGGLLGSVIEKNEMKKSLSAPLAEFLARPGTFVIPFTEIVETRHVRHGVFNQQCHIKRETPEGKIEEYWLFPADHGYPLLLMSLRAQMEKQLLFQSLLAEHADIEGLNAEFVADFRARHPDGHEPEDVAAAEKAYGLALKQRVEAKGLTMTELYLEAERRLVEAFADTPVFK